MARRAILSILVLLLAAWAPQAQALLSGRAAALGGVHVALADDLDTLFANPAGFRSARPQFALAELNLGLSGPIFDLTGLILKATSADPATLLADPEVQALMQGLYTAMNLVGPIAVGYVGHGLGLGLFNDSYTRISTRGAVPTVSTLVGESLTLAGGYSFRIPLPASSRCSLDLGFLLHVRARAEAEIDKDLLSFFSDFSDPTSILQDAPFRVGLGVGIDLGLLFSFANRFAFGIVGRDLCTPVFNFNYGTVNDLLAGASPVYSYAVEPFDLSAGLMFRPPLGFLGRYIDDLKLMLDYSDILDMLTHPVTSTNPILHAGFGVELVLLEIVALRAGIYQGLASAGVGFKLGKFMFNLAMFGTELSPEPGLRPVFNLMLELAFRF
jgi:hypothetical protein